MNPSLWLAALALSATPPLPNCTAPAEPAVAGSTLLSPDGLVVFRDPATGKPTAERPEGVTFALMQAETGPEAPAVQRQLASGAWIVAVPESVHSYTHVRSSIDGTPVASCSEEPQVIATPRVDANGQEIE